MKKCSNCGESYPNGEGFPEDEFECCCSIKCFLEFIEGSMNDE